MNPIFTDLVNQLKYLEKTTDSKQGILCLITDAVKENRRYILNNYTIRSAIKWCKENENWVHPLYGHISKWDISQVTNMNELFCNINFNEPIGEWNTGRVQDMSAMFKGTRFNQSIGKWDTSRVEDMSCMFQESIFNKSIGKWNTSRVKNMCSMFNSSKFNP